VMVGDGGENKMMSSSFLSSFLPLFIPIFSFSSWFFCYSLFTFLKQSSNYLPPR